MIKQLTTKMRFIALLAAFSISMGTVMAQTEFYQDVYRSDKMISFSRVPIYGLYSGKFFKDEFVYPASVMDSVADGTIKAMLFLSDTQKASYGKAVFQIFMKEINDVSLADGNYRGKDGATVVYEGPLSIEDNILVIEFTTPYHYKGGNLLIGIYEIAKGKSQSSVSFAGQKVTIGASITGASYSGVNDITKPTEVSDFIPMVRFIYTLSPREITASVNLKEGGSVKGAGKYEAAATCTLTAVANEGYGFSSWTENGVVVSNQPSYSFEVYQNRNLVANFMANGAVVATVNPKGSGIVNGAGSYSGGSKCTLTAVANNGYAFLNWTENGRLISANDTLSFVMSEGDINVEANFVKEVKGEDIVKFDGKGRLSEYQKTIADGTIFHNIYIKQGSNPSLNLMEMTITNRNGDWYKCNKQWTDYEIERFYENIDKENKTWSDAIKTLQKILQLNVMYNEDNTNDPETYKKLYMCQGNDLNELFRFFYGDDDSKTIKTAELNSKRETHILLNRHSWYTYIYSWNLNNTYLGATDCKVYYIDYDIVPGINYSKISDDYKKKNKDENPILIMLNKALNDGEILVKVRFDNYFRTNRTAAEFNRGEGRAIPQARIIYPDGRQYVGIISYNNLAKEDFNGVFQLDESFWDTITTINNIELYKGDMTYPDGKTETYDKENNTKTVVEKTGDITVYDLSTNSVNAFKTAKEQARAQGLKEEAARREKEAKEKEAAMQKIINELNAKYGKKYVDALARGEIVVGMHEDLFKLGVLNNMFNKVTDAKLDYESAGSKCYKLYGYKLYESSTRITLSGSAFIGWVWIKDGKISSIDWL